MRSPLMLDLLPGPLNRLPAISTMEQPLSASAAATITAVIFTGLVVMAWAYRSFGRCSDFLMASPVQGARYQHPRLHRLRGSSPSPWRAGADWAALFCCRQAP